MAALKIGWAFMRPLPCPLRYGFEVQSDLVVFNSGTHPHRLSLAILHLVALNLTCMHSSALISPATPQLCPLSAGMSDCISRHPAFSVTRDLNCPAHGVVDCVLDYVDLVLKVGDRMVVTRSFCFDGSPDCTSESQVSGLFFPRM